MQPFFIMKKLGMGCFGSFATHYRYFYYSFWKRIEFVSQGPAVFVNVSKRSDSERLNNTCVANVSDKAAYC
jgi:hypothetical protein